MSLVHSSTTPRTTGTARRGQRWAVVSTFPPTPCGLATFTQSLLRGLAGHGVDVDVVRVLEAVEPVPKGVRTHLVNGSPESLAAAVTALDGYDVVLLQHEFGIYGGPDGEEVLELLRGLSVPVVTVLHTVLAHPNDHQRDVLQAVVAASDHVVTMTRTARERLLSGYRTRPGGVHLIPHGAADALVALGAAAHDGVGASHRPLVLTWGLLGPGKGIEWAIDALAELTDLDPAPLYVVAGRTHPRVVEQRGEQYRDGLRARAVERGVGSDVVFDDHYLSPDDLHRLVRAADVVLLPYDSVEQVTSGVLIEAVAAGRPVVSTRFPHAVELLEGGAGLLVDQRDPAAIAAALRRVLTDPELAAGMSGAAQAIAPDLSWHAVAGRYLAVGHAVRPATGTAGRTRAGGGARPVAGRAAVDVRSSVPA